MEYINIDSSQYNNSFKLLKNHEWTKFIKIIETKDPNFDINTRDDQQNYFLSYAVIFNKYDVIKILLDNGAKIDIFDNEEHSILYIPIKLAYNDVLELILVANDTTIGISIIDIKDNTNKIPLHYAIMFKNIKAIELLLKYNSNVNIVDKHGYNALHLSIFSRSIEICEYILNNITNINAKCNTGETVLHLACNLQLNEIIKLLLKHNVNINAQDYTHEVTALQYCVQLNNVEIVKLLLNNNADVNIQDITGNTVLHYCIIENNMEIFDELCKIKNINMNLLNIKGEIPLHIVFKKYISGGINDSNITEYLIVMLDKSNLSIQDTDGNTCLHYLIQTNLWKDYTDILVKKRLNIFIPNAQNQMVINMFGSETNKETNKEKVKTNKDYELFINLIVASYFTRLKKVNEKWSLEWENICNREFSAITDEESKQLGKDINAKNFDTTCKSIITLKINKLIKDINDGSKIECYNRSYPVKKSKVCLDIYEGNPTNFCSFTGTTLDILIGLLYLLKKHKDACSTLNTNFIENKDLCGFYKSIGIIMNSKCEFLNFEIIWVHQKIYLSEGFFEQFKLCKLTKRFIIIPVGIEMREGSHANYMIYDKLYNEIERFEPHGTTTPVGLNYNPTLFDDILESRFKLIDENIKYIRPKDYLPKIGFQLLDVTENNKKKIGDPSGFCALWSIWYVDMRLTHKTLTRNKLVKKLIKTIKTQNMSFKNMIRNYGKNIVDIRDAILSKVGMDINDWLNDQYTDIQINSIIERLTSDIENIKK